MFIPTKKGQYALRAVYELARRKEEGPTKVSAIAEAQAIPHRFLEVILNQLKGSGLVVSKRGFYGGYVIAKSPDQISVGDILRFVFKEQMASDCAACITRSDCPFTGKCAFSSLWQKVLSAAFQVYDSVSIQDLLDEADALGLVKMTFAGDDSPKTDEH